MHFNLFTMSVSLLVLLTGTALAHCNTEGASWSDIGDDDAITKAFSDLCSHMAGDYEIGSRIESCTNVKKNRINARIDISQQPENGTTAVPLYKEVCEDLLGQVKKSCHDRDGVIDTSAHAGSEFHQWGYVHGKIKADPNRHNC